MVGELNDSAQGVVASDPDAAPTVFRKVRIDASNRRFACRRGLRTLTLAWRDCRIEAIGPVVSLANEIGVRVAGPGARFVLAETDPGFWTWFEAVGLSAVLPANWYERAERGESFAPSGEPDAGP